MSQRSRVTGMAQIASSGGSSADALLKTNNLSDLADAAAARTNLALASGATTDASTLVLKANNLSDLADAPTARTNLGLHGGALLDVGTTAGTLAAGDDSRFTPGPLALTLAAATADGLTLKVTGDTQQRFTANADGKLEWSAGSGSIDTNLYRSAAGTVATDGALLVQSGVIGVRNVSTDPTNLAAMANFNNASMPWPVGVATAYGIVTAVTTQDVTATSVIAARLSATAGNGATVATARGLQVQGITTSGGGTVADARGIYVAAQSAGTASYGVAVDAAATATLWLSADTNSTAAAGGIAFGSSRDTTVYRYASAQLATQTLRTVAADGAALGAEKLTNAAFLTDLSGWTVGGTTTGWTWSSGALHAAGNTDPLSQALTGMSSGGYYYVQIAITGRTVGAVTVDIGGVTSTTQVTNVTGSLGFALIPTSTTPTLTITPGSTFDGKITNVSVKLISAATPHIYLDSSLGTEAGRLAADSHANLGIGNLALSQINYDAGYTAPTNNVALGSGALRRLVTGALNVAVGSGALGSGTSAASNVAVGYNAAISLTTGGNNTIVGSQAGYNSGSGVANAITTGVNNTWIGTNAGFTSTTQSNGTVALGLGAGVDGTNATALGSNASAGAAGAVAIGRDNGGTAASTTTANEFKFGTTAHIYNFPGATVTLADAASLVLGTTTGLKIGTAANQKIGFWNTTPVVQPAGWGTPTGTLTRTTFVSDSATLVQVATRLAALITDLKTTGLLGA